MEETEFLQDLLECSVCLCTLSQQSKLLPCQHTFCLSCLQEILQTQNELRCPECRCKVSVTSLDELPPNILLNRLLEGLKHNMRIKNSNRLSKTPNQTPMKQTGKLSLLQQTPTTSSNQRQFIANNNKSSNLQMSNPMNNHGLPPCLSVTINCPQYISTRQQWPIAYNNRQQQLINNGNSLQSSSTHSVQNNRRPQMNLDNTLIKQPLTDVALSLNNNNLQQTNCKTLNAVNTPTSSMTPNLPSMASIVNPNLNGNLFALNNQLINKPIMMNARALRDSDQIGDWTIKKNDILFIKEQLNKYWYLAIFNGIQGVVPISFVELIPGNAALNKNNTNCKTIQTQSNYSTLPSSMNSNPAIYQTVGNNVNNLSVHNDLNNKQHPPSQLTIANALQQAQSVGIQLPLPQQFFQQFTLCRALYDFRINDLNDKNCLNFKKNDLITLISRIDEWWLEGSLDNKIGILPINFVEFLPTIRPTTSSRSSSQQSNFNQSNKQTTGLPVYHQNRPQSLKKNSSLISNRNTINNISHSRSNSIDHQQPHPNQISPDIVHTRSNSISILNGNGNSSNVQANIQMNLPHHCANNDFNTNPKLPLQNSLPFNLGYLESSLETDSNLINLSSNSNSNSFDNLLDGSSDQNKSAQNLYVAIYNYHPSKKDELALKKNELYIVDEKYIDGWCKGRSVKDNILGVFPNNYVVPKNNAQIYQNVIANRRSFGNLSTAKFDSADNLLNNDAPMNLTKQLLTSSIDNNLSDLNNTISKISLNAKSENFLSNQSKNEQQGTMSKSVEQLNNYDSKSNKKSSLKSTYNNDSNSSSTNSSPQWIQPSVKATRSSSKNEQKKTSQDYSLVYNNSDLNDELRIEISKNGNNTTHVIKQLDHTPVKKEDKKINLIKMFTGKLNRVDKQKNAFNYSCDPSFDNPSFIDISPKS